MYRTIKNNKLYLHNFLMKRKKIEEEIRHSYQKKEKFRESKWNLQKIKRNKWNWKNKNSLHYKNIKNLERCQIEGGVPKKQDCLMLSLLV